MISDGVDIRHTPILPLAAIPGRGVTSKAMTVSTTEASLGIPAIDLLDDPTLRSAVRQAWQAALDQSPYGSLSEVPQSPFMPRRSLLLHVNEVNERTLNVMELAEREFGLTMDRDLALATAILHDVDKPLMYRVDNGEFGYADGVVLSEHGALGAALCLAQGVPARVADLVRVHSPFASVGLPGTVEGTIVHYADFLSNDLACLQQGAALIHTSFDLTPKAH
jgi:putative nucleotidyltransferase with HDIG domain